MNHHIPMNLQLFAETNETQPSEGASQEPQQSARTFTQEEVNRIVEERLERERRSAQARNEAYKNGSQGRLFTEDDVNRIVADRLARDRKRRQASAQETDQPTETPAAAGAAADASEAQEPADAQEPAEPDTQESTAPAEPNVNDAFRMQQEALEAREAEITRRELHVQAMDLIASRGLPRELESILDLSSAEACNASLNNIEQAFHKAVQQGINERLRASGVRADTLPMPSFPDIEHMSDADYYAHIGIGRK